MATATIPAREMRTEDNLHYVKFDGQTTYVLASNGFTSWEQQLNPITSDGNQYIGDSVKFSGVTGYEPKVAYSMNSYPSDAFSKFVYDTTKQQVIGATFEEIEVETWNETASGVYNAYKRSYVIQPDTTSNEGGGVQTMSGTFAQSGAQVSGTFDIAQKTFTEAGSNG